MNPLAFAGLDLDAIVGRMRGLGIVHMKMDGLELLLGPEPTKASRAVTAMRAIEDVVAEKVRETHEQQEASVTREATDEEILFASARGWPKDAG